MAKSAFLVWALAIFCQIKKIKHLRGGVVLYAAPAKVMIDAELVKKGSFRTETNSLPAGVLVKNKLLRLAEMVQENFPEDLVEAFRSHRKQSLESQLTLVGRACTAHQRRSESLWLKAGKKRTSEERRAAAQADLAGFLFACLTGDAKEYAETATEALQVLGRHGEIDLIMRLTRRR